MLNGECSRFGYRKLKMELRWAPSIQLLGSTTLTPGHDVVVEGLVILKGGFGPGMKSFTTGLYWWFGITCEVLP